MKTRLGWPGRWLGGTLYDDGGLPVHLYPMPVNAKGEGPCDESDPDYDHDECWCSFDECIGIVDEFGFPVRNDEKFRAAYEAERQRWQELTKRLT